MKFSLFLAAYSAVLLVTKWLISVPEEWAEFLQDPLLNLPTRLVLVLLGAAAACLIDGYLQATKATLFSRRADWPALLLASAVIVFLPFHSASGLLFAYLLFSGRAIFTVLLQSPDKRRALLGSVEGIRGIFFISGMAALIYQITWQRMLIGLLGADGQSVTVIVAVFLGGLGCGALLGEKLAQRLSENKAIFVFFLIEMAIGLFGFFSAPWLEWVGLQVSGSLAPGVVILAAAGALLAPTILMGMTLPILVEALRNKVPEIHQNVGRLYALNALGSATAALFSATALFPFTGLIGATRLAAIINGLTALLVLLASAAWPKGAIPRARPMTIDMSNTPLSWPAAAVLVIATGFVSISQEILLLRMMSWATASRPWVFGLGVGAFLLGMGLGSERIAKLDKSALLAEASKIWAFTALATMFLPALAALVGGVTVTSAGALLLALALAVLGFFGGSSLPLVAGAIRPNQNGRVHFGLVYAANIMGAVAGSAITGYVLLDHFTTSQCLAMATLGALLLALIFAVAAGKSLVRTAATLPVLMTIIALPASEIIYGHWKEWLYNGSVTEQSFVSTVETRAGIIAVKSDPTADIVIGGGAYDGRFNIDPLLDTNLIHRAYIAIAMSPAPLRVLEIGLSSGSWAKAILSFKNVRELVTVEINAGYTSMISREPLVSEILHASRAQHVTADGRKWLRADKTRFDAIIINNSFHWREGATMLHSLEFMQLARAHLNANGILFINTTGATSIEATALQQFPEVYRISNGIVAVNGHLRDVDVHTLASRLMNSTEFKERIHTALDAEGWVTGHFPQRLDPNHYSGCVPLSDNAMALEWDKAKCRPHS
ncbi:MAG: hypothetical protein HY066_05325 [Betaproteobacteria bacterium]|nr:hypothetical protein [Betaproteobacteria bacterium]